MHLLFKYVLCLRMAPLETPFVITADKFCRSGIMVTLAEINAPLTALGMGILALPAPVDNDFH